MRGSILILLVACACHREVRSTNPDLWLELQSEHFTLRTDLPGPQATQAIVDLELLRNALLAAGWHAADPSRSRFETFAWALVHWLIDTRPAQFDRFIELLARGDGNWTAFNAAFPELTERQLEAEVLEHHEHAGNYVRAAFPFAAWRGEVALRKLPPAEALAQRAELFLTSRADGWKARALAAARLAAAADPANPLALAILGDEGAPAIATHPEDWRSWSLVYGQHGDEAALRRAAELAPDNARLMAQLAVAALRSGDARQASARIEAALRDDPTLEVLDALAAIELAQGRCEAALRAEERAADALADSASQSRQNALRERVDAIAEACAVGKAIDAAPRSPVKCNIALDLRGMPISQVKARFTVLEDGSVSAVAVRGVPEPERATLFRQFIESCRYERSPGARRLDVPMSAFVGVDIDP